MCVVESQRRQAAEQDMLTYSGRNGRWRKGQTFEEIILWGIATTMNLLDGFIFSLVGFALCGSSTAFTVTLAHYSLCRTDPCVI